MSGNKFFNAWIKRNFCALRGMFIHMWMSLYMWHCSIMPQKRMRQKMQLMRLSGRVI